MLSVAAALGVSAAIWGMALGIIPPLHLYKQLRGAYGLSRFGAVAAAVPVEHHDHFRAGAVLDSAARARTSG